MQSALRVAALAALVLVPAFAFDAGMAGTRRGGGAVATDQDAYVHLTNHGPTSASPVVLSAQAGYEGDILTVRNGYAASSRMALQASLAPGDPARFRIMNPDAVLAAGATHTFRLEDTAARPERLCTPLSVQLRATLLDASGLRRGGYIDQETVHVRVGARC